MVSSLLCCSPPTQQQCICSASKKFTSNICTGITYIYVVFLEALYMYRLERAVVVSHACVCIVYVRLGGSHQL